MFFTQIYIYDNNNKNIYMLIYKKSLKKCPRLFNKTFSNYQAIYQKELYLLFEKSGNFSQIKHIDRFDSCPPPVCFHSLFKEAHSKSFLKQGLLEEMEGVNNDASAFMHLNIKTIMEKKLLFKSSRVIYVTKFLNFMVMQMRKPENEGTFLGSNEKKNAGKEQRQH